MLRLPVLIALLYDPAHALDSALAVHRPKLLKRGFTQLNVICEEGTNRVHVLWPWGRPASEKLKEMMMRVLVKPRGRKLHRSSVQD